MKHQQASLISNTSKLPKKKLRGNSTKDKTSRYSDFAVKLEKDIENQNWFLVNTDRVSNKKSKFNFLDLFAGAGGMSQGFRSAGLNKVLSVEIDSDASETLRHNFPESNHIEGDINQITESDIDKELNGKKVHVICGGPPCQGFSVAGLRNPKDPRNKLFKEFIRVVRHVKPWYVVMENVPGILTMENGKVYKEIINQFALAGYPNMTVRILEAATFGVPQLRTRAIFIANRFGRVNPYPKKTHAPKDYVSIDEVIGDLIDKPYDPESGHWGTRHSKKFEERISKVKPGESLYETYRDAYKRQYKGVPSMAIKENHGGVHIHYELNRVLTVREMARLQTFPDDFWFSGSHKRGYWQIGNAVPTLMAKHIALAIKNELLDVKKISLRDPSYLKLDSKTSSTHQNHTKDNQHNLSQPPSLF
ncbi:DNA cytosine methyltransferase [Patescibacteria group bacterium]